jgi:TPR repeat protein
MNVHWLLLRGFLFLLTASTFAACATSPTVRGREAIAAGDGVRATELLLGPAAAGDAEAQYLLGLLNDEGCGVPADATTAAHWYRLAATQGVAAAQNNLGLLFHSGRGVPRSFEKAIDLFTAAAANGFAGANTNLGVMHVFGQGVPRDADRGIGLIETAAGSGDARANVVLGSVRQRIASLQVAAPAGR